MHFLSNINKKVGKFINKNTSFFIAKYIFCDKRKLQYAVI